jgi:hypothetical protein
MKILVNVYTKRIDDLYAKNPDVQQPEDTYCINFFNNTDERYGRRSGTFLYNAFSRDSAAEHKFGFSLATSLMVECEDQAEIDRLWSALSAVPEAEQCGWLKDEFGVSWQIVPKDFLQYVNAQSAPIIYSMKKFDIAQMKKAAGL